MFAINTDHAVNRDLNRHQSGWMIWSDYEVSLAWLGFADLHSGIERYEVSVGSSYMATDLNKVICFDLLKYDLYSCKDDKNKQATPTAGVSSCC